MSNQNDGMDMFDDTDLPAPEHPAELTFKVKKLTKLVQIPKYATEGSACFDFFIPGDPQSMSGITLMPGRQVTVPLGLAFELQPNTCLQIYSRSGHAKNGIRLANSVAIIDSDYRGEVLVMLRNDGDKPVVLYPGNKIAQGMIVDVTKKYRAEVVEELSETARGTGGFGSTGA